MREYIVPSLPKAVSLHSFLSEKFPRGFVRKVFDKKGVRVNGERGKEETILKGKEVLTFYIPLETGVKKMTHCPVDIIYEDTTILILNKKAGIAVHEGKNTPLQKSLIGKLQTWYADKNITPYLVHRLDKDTSGCLLVVKQENQVPLFEKMFETGTIQKEYVALVKGIIQKEKGDITSPLPGRDGYLVRAETSYIVQERFPKVPATLVRVIIHTGRMHQIRLHFASIGYPIIMDNEHGDFSFNKQFRKTYHLQRQFLHAEKISFMYQQKQQLFTAPWTSDLIKTVNSF